MRGIVVHVILGSSKWRRTICPTWARREKGNRRRTRGRGPVDITPEQVPDAYPWIMSSGNDHSVRSSSSSEAGGRTGSSVGQFGCRSVIARCRIVISMDDFEFCEWVTAKRVGRNSPRAHCSGHTKYKKLGSGKLDFTTSSDQFLRKINTLAD